MLKTVVSGIGIEQDASRAVLLGHEGLDATKALAVADENNLAAHIDLGLLQPVEVFRRAVVGVDHFAFDISRGRHSVKGWCNTRVVLVGVGRNPLRRWAVHLHSLRGCHVHADLLRIVHPHAIFDDLRF